MASRISVMVTGEFFRLKRLSLTGIFAVADLLEGLILLTTLSAAVAKKVLNDSAISDGSLMLVSLIVSEVQFSLLFLVFRIALDKSCQVLRRSLQLFGMCV